MLFIKGIYLLLSHLPTPTPSAVASPIVHQPSDCPIGAMRKTAEERFNMLARGWLAYPVTPTQGTGTRTIGMRQRRITPRNPIRTKRQRRAHGASAGTIYMRFGDALLRRPRKRSRLQLTPDRVGGTRTDAYAPRSAAAERSIAKCRKLGRRKMLFIKAFTSYFHIYRPPTPSAVASPLRPPSSSDCANGAIHRHRKNRRRAV